MLQGILRPHVAVCVGVGSDLNRHLKIHRLLRIPARINEVLSNHCNQMAYNASRYIETSCCGLRGARILGDIENEDIETDASRGYPDGRLHIMHVGFVRQARVCQEGSY